MKKSRNIGIVFGLIMIVIIILGSMYKKWFGPIDNNSTLKESVVPENESLQETTYQKTVESDGSAKASLRNYDFEVKEVSFHQNENESNYLEIWLIITNHASVEEVMALNSISLIKEDSEGNELEQFQLNNINDINAEKTEGDYFHYSILPNESSEVKLFYQINSDGSQQENEWFLHFNPFGTEGAIMHGKNEKGEIVEITDTDNVTNIYLNPLIEVDE